MPDSSLKSVVRYNMVRAGHCGVILLFFLVGYGCGYEGDQTDGFVLGKFVVAAPQTAEHRELIPYGNGDAAVEKGSDSGEISFYLRGESELPVANVPLQIFRDGVLYRNLITSEDGRAVFPAEPGKYEVRSLLNVEDYTTSVKKRDLKFETVSGNVHTGTGGAASGAKIHFYYSNNRGYLAIADSSGDYSLTMPPNAYVVEGYAPNGDFIGRDIITLAPGETLTNYNFTVATGTVSGTVKRKTTAINNAKVKFELSQNRGKIAFTNSSGAYSATLPVGTYKMEVYDAAGIIITTRTLTVTAGSTTTGINFVLTPANVDLSLYDENVAIATGAYLMVDRVPNRGVRALMSSAVISTQLNAGDWRIFGYDSSGDVVGFQDVTLPSSGTTTIRFDIRPGSLSGTVTPNRTLQACLVVNRCYSATSDETGHFNIARLQNATYALSVLNGDAIEVTGSAHVYPFSETVINTDLDTTDPLKRGLAAHYHFNEASGSSIADTSGNGSNGAFGSPAPTWATGLIGSSLSFASTTDRATVTDSTALHFGNRSFSVAAWLKTTQTGTNKALVNKQIGTGSGFALRMTNGKLFFQVDRGSSASKTGTSIINNGAWHFVVGVRDVESKLIRLYVDGTADGTANDTVVGSTDAAESLAFGARSDGTHQYQGQIDEVRLYKRALTAAEIGELYNDGLGLETH